MADGENGLQILDASDPSNIFRVGNYTAAISLTNSSLYTNCFAYAVQIVGKVAYVTDRYEGLQAFDVSKPREVTKLGNLSYDRYYSFDDLQVADQRAYVGTSKGLRIFDVSDPTSIKEVGRFDTATPVEGVRLSGSMVYLELGQGGYPSAKNLNPPAPKHELRCPRVGAPGAIPHNADSLNQHRSAAELLRTLRTSYDRSQSA